MKSFILNTSNIERDSFIWNMAGSLLMAFQSVIFLMILTRTVGLVESGVFTIAYANANLFLNIGKYGMRNYQVSDVKNQFSFRTYLSSRWITTIVMIVVSVIYVLYTGNANHYTIEKSQVIIWMCLFKVPDSMEDIYYGDYQKKGRLDVGSKAMTLRMIITIILFSVIVIITGNLLLTLIISTCVTSAIAAIFIVWTYPIFKENIPKTRNNVCLLLKSCLPVFLSSFLAFYIGNAPKYAIDAQLTDELQACYGFIAMPVFVIGLLNSFIFNPILFRISCLWNDKKIHEFVKNIVIQVVIVAGITIVCIFGAYILGIPILSILYSTDLSLYKTELLVLLLGGGFLGLSGVLTAVITIMRYQNALVVGYMIVAVIAFLLSNSVVKKYEMMGAAVLYVGLMFMLCMGFIIILIIGLKKASRREKVCEKNNI